MQFTQSTQNAAYALMILFACLIISNYGRDAAVAATNGPEAQMGAVPGYASGAAVAPVQYGLVQTGIASVGSMDGTGRQSIMPVFQVIQLQSGAAWSSSNAMLPNATGTADGSAPQSNEPKIPQGMSVTPSAGTGMSGTLCEIKGIRALTQTPEACGAAGGQVLAL